MKKNSNPSLREDKEHLRTCYALLNEAIDELAQVYRKDNITAHAMRVMGAIEDSLYQILTEDRRAV